jgi:predicted Na+-dependent transporter
MTALRHFIESHFGLVLLLSCAVGLVAPLSNVPDDSASVALAMLTYASCFKLRDGGFSDINWKDVAWFYIARYIILPVILFGIAHVITPDYALGIFLLALVPAAVSSPAFAHMFGGRVPPAFAIVIVSTLLAPFLIPLQFMWASEVAMDISPLGLFKTLAFCIFLPMALYFATRRFQTWGQKMYDNVKVISIVLVAFVIALVIAKQRDVILGDIPALLTPTIAAFGCYAIFMLCAKWLGRNQPSDVQITYMICSGFNNVALGVSLALLHFPAKIILLVAVSEMAWSTLPIMMKLLLRRASAS